MGLQQMWVVRTCPGEDDRVLGSLILTHAAGGSLRHGLSCTEGSRVQTVVRGPVTCVRKMTFHIVNEGPDTETTSRGGKAIQL